MASLAKTKEGKKKPSFSKSLPLLLIALPGIVYLVINNYIPIMGLFLAFKDYNFMKGIFKVTGVVSTISNFCLSQRMPGL